MNTWIISDTHFFHDKIMEYCNRPKNYNDLIIENWRNRVLPCDLVIHLGDVIFYKRDQLKSIMASLPGTKMLILGNHDKKSGKWFINNGFDYVINYLVYNNILFTHKPIDNLGYEEKVNIHGHIHNNMDAIKKLKPFNVNYSIEIENYRPVLLEMLLRNRNKQ